MRRFAWLALVVLCLVAPAAQAQVYTALNAVSADTTGTALDTGGSSGIVVQISSASTSSAVVTIQQSLDGTIWTAKATCEDPGSTPTTRCLIPLGTASYTRLVVSDWVSGIITGRIAVNRTGRNPTMVGATDEVDGVGGTVPPPQASEDDLFLNNRGVWATPAGGGGSGDVTGVTVTGTAPVSVTGSPCTTGACAFTLGLDGVTVDADGWHQSIPVTGGVGGKGYFWNVATDGGYPDFGLNLTLAGLELIGDGNELVARKKITVKSNATGGANSGYCYHDGVSTEQCLQFNFGTGVLSLPTITLATPLAVADGGTGVSSFGQNTVLAGPTSGGAGTATARSLVAGDIPTLNQNTTGSAATLTTARNIFGQSFDGSAALAGLGTFNLDNLGTTSTDGILLSNTTAATSGVTAQYSPRLRFVGSGWKTNATAAAQATEWIVETVPTSRAVAPDNALVFTPRRDGVASSTPLWMCQADTGGFVGLVLSGTTGRCDNSIGFSGIGYAGANVVGFFANAALSGNLSSTGFGLPATGVHFWNNTTLSTSGTTSGDLYISRGAAATLQLGAAAAASPVAQALQAQGSRSGTDSNVGGGSLTIRPGTGTGTGTPSDLTLQGMVGAASGTGAQTPTAALTIKGAANGALPEVVFNGSSSPASGASCTAGAITWDADYIYVCTASGAWKRAALTGGY